MYTCSKNDNMPLRLLLTAFVLMITSYASEAQKLTPIEIIDKSINYHDPEGKMLKNKLIFSFLETRPKGKDRRTVIEMNVKKEKFQMAQVIDNIQINSFYNRGIIGILVDGEKTYSEVIAKKYRLSNQRVAMMKNYYEYLWLLPMKLKDPGTNLNPMVKEVDFFGKQSLEIRVTYDPAVGSDVWYFYFHPQSYALQGYRFYHEEEKNDGEYILLEGETTQDKIRIPRSRTWYTHKEDKLLGTDILESIKL